MNSHIDKATLKSELDFSKSIIDGLTSKKPGAMDEVFHKANISQEEISEMASMGEAVAQITGMDDFKINLKDDKKKEKPSKPSNPTKGRQDERHTHLQDILSEAIEVLENSNKKIPQNLIKKVVYANKKIYQCEKFLLRFIEKYH